jgi:hypothetical protein
MNRPCKLIHLLTLLYLLTCVGALAQQDQPLPPITVPWDFYAYEHHQVILWRVEPDSFRVAEVSDWNGKTLWRSQGYGDVTWAFQDSAGHQVGEGFYRVRIETSSETQWASMNIHWRQHINIVQDNGRQAVVVVAGPDSGTGFTATITNHDTSAWVLTGLTWWTDPGQQMELPIATADDDSTGKSSIILLPYGVNAYRVRLISPEPVHLDSLHFAVITETIAPQDSTIDVDQ